MFENEKEKLNQKLKRLNDQICGLKQDETYIKNRLAKLDDLEKEIAQNPSSNKCKQSFELTSEKLKDVHEDFIKNANNWINEHEQLRHTNIYYNFLHGQQLKQSLDYEICFSWTQLGRLVSVECVCCREAAKNNNSSLSMSDYMFVEEA